jgi:hypothetical protein
VQGRGMVGEECTNRATQESIHEQYMATDQRSGSTVYLNMLNTRGESNAVTLWSLESQMGC